MRSSKYAEDLTTTEDTLKHALDSYEEYTGKKYDICVFLTATDIFRRVEWIDDAIKTLLDHKDIESAFSANETTKNYWTKSDNGWDRILPWMREYSSRQIRNKIYREDTGIACASRAELWRQGRRIGDNVHIIPNSFTEVSIDIHTEFDLFMAENAIEYLKINDPDRVSIFME